MMLTDLGTKFHNIPLSLYNGEGHVYCLAIIGDVLGGIYPH